MPNPSTALNCAEYSCSTPGCLMQSDLMHTACDCQLRYDHTTSVDNDAMCCRSQHTDHCCTWLDTDSQGGLAGQWQAVPLSSSDSPEDIIVMTIWYSLAVRLKDDSDQLSIIVKPMVRRRFDLEAGLANGKHIFRGKHRFSF